MKLKIYIVITHSANPATGKNKGKWEVTENCEFVDRIKARHTESASVILDYVNKKIVKDRNRSGSYDDYYQYVETNYPEKLKELNKVYEDITNKNA